MTRGIEAKVFDCAAAGDHERVVVFGLDLIEGGVEREIVAALLGVRLIAFEIVDAGGNEFASFLSRADQRERCGRPSEAPRMEPSLRSLRRNRQ